MCKLKERLSRSNAMASCVGHLISHLLCKTRLNFDSNHSIRWPRLRNLKILSTQMLDVLHEWLSLMFFIFTAFVLAKTIYDFLAHRCGCLLLWNAVLFCLYYPVFIISLIVRSCGTSCSKLVACSCGTPLQICLCYTIFIVALLAGVLFYVSEFVGRPCGALS